MLDVSFNEVETLVVKAARGAGLSWGLAEDAGRAARWLASLDLPWPRALIPVLTDPHDEPRVVLDNAGGLKLSPPRGGRLSPLLCGTYLTDRAGDIPDGGIRLARVTSPLWLLPFLGQATLSRPRAIRLQCGDAVAIVAGRNCLIDAGAIETLSAQGARDVMCTEVDTPEDEPVRARVDRAWVPIELWRALDELASRTYVPASAESRALGAGAGDTDND